MQLVSKISKLCGPDPPTSQTDGSTDGQTDNMHSQYRALHYNASRSNNTKGHTSHDICEMQKSEELPILAVPLRFVASYALNPHENSYKPLFSETTVRWSNYCR